MAQRNVQRAVFGPRAIVWSLLSDSRYEWFVGCACVSAFGPAILPVDLVRAQAESVGHVDGNRRTCCQHKE